MENFEILAKDILAACGGEKNIAAVSHCATRLRITLKDWWAEVLQAIYKHRTQHPVTAPTYHKDIHLS